jgi:predicted metal-dependent HD superfamily phosphohydrolase
MLSEAELRAAWSRDAGASRQAGVVLDDLLGRFREPHRRYHTVKHLASVLATADELLQDVAVPDPGAVRLGAWFHDAVYDPGSDRNEQAPAGPPKKVVSLRRPGRAWTRHR